MVTKNITKYFKIKKKYKIKLKKELLDNWKRNMLQELIHMRDFQMKKKNFNKLFMFWII